MKQRQLYCFLVLIAGVFGLFILNLCIGSVNIPLNGVINSLMCGQISDTFSDIIFKIRLPRVTAAFILGGALALSGYLLQTFFHNPIAGPFVLGISSGSKLAVALFMVYGIKCGIKITSEIMVLWAFVGAVSSMIFVLCVSRVLKESAMIIVSGVMIGYICSAITDFVVTFADDSNIVNLHNWSLGSFSGISMEHIGTITFITSVTFIVVFFISKPISAYIMGEGYAESIGVNTKLLRILLVILSSILSGCVTAFAGPVSFVGIAVSHIVKPFLKTSKPILMIPACFLGGGIFCMLCDFLSRMLLSPVELSVSTVTAVLGAPVVLYVMIKCRKER